MTHSEENAKRMIEEGKSFNGKIYESRKGFEIYVANQKFQIQPENIEFFKNAKKNYSLGFAVNINSRSQVVRAERFGYDAIES